MPKVLRFFGGLQAIGGLIWAFLALPTLRDCRPWLGSAELYNTCMAGSPGAASFAVPAAIALSCIVAAVIQFAIARLLDQSAENRAILERIEKQLRGDTAGAVFSDLPDGRRKCGACGETSVAGLTRCWSCERPFDVAPASAS